MIFLTLTSHLALQVFFIGPAAGTAGENLQPQSHTGHKFSIFTTKQM